MWFHCGRGEVMFRISKRVLSSIQCVDLLFCRHRFNLSATLCMWLTLSDFCTDISVRKLWPAVTFVRIYPYTDFAIEIWGFYRRLNDTLRYHHTRCSRDFGLQLATILKHVYQRKKSWVYSELSAVFGEFWKITIVGPSSIHRLAWNTTANYMDFLPWKWS